MHKQQQLDSIRATSPEMEQKKKKLQNTNDDEYASVEYAREKNSLIFDFCESPFRFLRVS